MTKLPLNCPHCRKPLVYVPLDGLTLHYRCEQHGAIILRPLLVVEPDDRRVLAGARAPSVVEPGRRLSFTSRVARSARRPAPWA